MIDKHHNYSNENDRDIVLLHGNTGNFVSLGDVNTFGYLYMAISAQIPSILFIFGQ